MKLSSFFWVAGLSFTLAFTVSCSGDAGKEGPQGIQGISCTLSSTTEETKITCGDEYVIIPNSSNNQGNSDYDNKICEAEQSEDDVIIITCGEETFSVTFLKSSSSSLSISSSSNLSVSSSSFKSSSSSLSVSSSSFKSSSSSLSVSSSSFKSSSSIMQINMQMQQRVDTTGISYYEAILICNKMSLEDNLDTLYQYDEIKPADDSDLFWLPNIKVLEDKPGYRLPTKDEWELAKENGEINDDNNEIGEWLYRGDANSQYATFDLAPQFLKAVGLYKNSVISGYPVYGMRIIKITVIN